MNFKVAESKGRYGLMRESEAGDYISICPYQTPMLVPVQSTIATQGPSAAIQRWQCGSDCPFFEVYDKEDKEVTVELHCMSKIRKFQAEVEEVKESKLTLVKGGDA